MYYIVDDIFQFYFSVDFFQFIYWNPQVLNSLCSFKIHAQMKYEVFTEYVIFACSRYCSLVLPNILTAEQAINTLHKTVYKGSIILVTLNTKFLEKDGTMIIKATPSKREVSLYGPAGRKFEGNFLH